MRRDALAETYSDVRTLLDAIACRHCRQFGGHKEDIRADANSLFVEAYDSFDPEKGDFFNWVKYFVWIRLLYSRRSQLRESARYTNLNLEEVSLGRNDPNYFDLEDFISGISQDAGYVVQLALQGVGGQGGTRGKQGARMKAPRNKGGTRTKVVENKGVGRPKTVGAAIRRYLCDLGWSVRRVTSTFQEIREAL